MNRPEKKDYKGNLNYLDYEHDMRKYCDELESKINTTINELNKKIIDLEERITAREWGGYDHSDLDKQHLLCKQILDLLKGE